MAALSAHALEENLGSLGVGLHTYREAHRRTCDLCTQEYTCSTADMDLEYQLRRREFRRQVFAAWRSMLGDVLAMQEVARDWFASALEQLQDTTRRLCDAECRLRERELGLVPLAPLADAALPEAIHNVVLELAESPNPLAQRVAGAIDRLGCEILATPFSDMKRAKLAFDLDEQRLLGKLKMGDLVTYTLARRRFEDAETMFLGETESLLRRYRGSAAWEMESWLNWLMEGADPPLRLVVQERRAA